MKAQEVKESLATYASPEDAIFLQRFFKTGAGQYGEGDIFIGVRVPQTRAVCRQFRSLPLPEIQNLLESKVHEHRLAALVIMTLQYPGADNTQKKALYESYLKNLYAGNINNWDLVDMSAEHIVGPYLQDKNKVILYELVKSNNIWQRRVAILSTFTYIKQGDYQVTFEVAERLLKDPHDLIQKAVGWMLREVGKRIDEELLVKFLDRYALEMPRTMLRYSIERLSADQKSYFMKLK